MKSSKELHDYCVNQVCEYYASHRDLMNGAAGVIEPHEVICISEEESYKDGHAKRLDFSTKSADGMRFIFTVVPNYDATKVTMEVYRFYDIPKVVHI